MTKHRPKKLSAVFAAIGEAGSVPEGLAGLEITGIECCPNKVRPGFLYCCMDEYLRYNVWCRGEDGIEEAVRRGAAVVLCSQPVKSGDVPQVRVKDPRRALGFLAKAFYGAPDEAVAPIGVTGTNGKTTTTRLLAHLLSSSIGPCGSMGTLGMFLGERQLEAGEYTTALAHVNFQHFRRFREEGARFAAMEVSSHALELDRTAGIRFAGGILTNFTRDHLDFHGSMEAYAAAKRRLFETLDADAFAVINRDTERSSFFAEGLAARVVTYGRGEGADWTVRDVEALPRATRFVAVRRGVGAWPVTARLVGRFQVYNVLGAMAAAVELGSDPEKAAAAVSGFPPVPGRMENFDLPNGAAAILDFAHNPDGLDNLLENCRALRPRRLIVVFGCGGDRDAGKRPLMGGIATEKADVCWVTSDNPRTEDSEAIIRDILKGCASREKVRVEPNRAKAIGEAYADSGQGDVLVIAGKGHEDYQLIGETKYPYSDREEILKLMRPEC